MITLRQVLDICECGNVNEIKNFIDSDRSRMCIIFKKIWNEKNFYLHEEIVLLLLDEFVDDIGHNTLGCIFGCICQYTSFEFVKKIYKKYPDVEFYYYDGSISDDIILSKNINIINYVTKKFKFHDPNFIINKVFNLAIHDNDIQFVKNFINSQEFDNDLLVKNYENCVKGCMNDGTLEFMLYLFELFDNMELSNDCWDNNEFYCRNLDVLKLCIDRYPYCVNYIDSNFIDECLYNKHIDIVDYVVENNYIEINNDNFIFEYIFFNSLEVTKYIINKFPQLDFCKGDYKMTDYMNPDTFIYLIKMFPEIVSCIDKHNVFDCIIIFNLDDMIYLFEIFIPDCDKCFKNLSNCLGYLYDCNKIDEYNYLVDNFDINPSEYLNIKKLFQNCDFEYAMKLISNENIYEYLDSYIGQHDYDQYCKIILFINQHLPNMDLDNEIYNVWYDNNGLNKFKFLIENNLYGNINTRKLLKKICCNNTIRDLENILSDYSYLLQNYSINDIFEFACKNNNHDLVIYYLTNNFDELINNVYEPFKKYFIHLNKLCSIQ